LLVAGWHEQVALSALGIDQVFAKLDTGADSSALHARDPVIVTAGEARLVEFTAPLLRSQTSCHEFPPGGVRRVRAPLVEEKIFRSSSGQDEMRLVILTPLTLGSLRFDAHFSLTNREGLRFAVLIGRDALSGRVLVSSEHAHLLPLANPAAGS
jgi:ribosomal protein S6--L-glutamate ligase